VATILSNKNHIPLISGMLFTMPGIPCVYYGSEWGAEGDKKGGDPGLRLSYDEPCVNELTTFISKLSEIKKNSKALNYGNFKSLHLTNKQCVFERCCDGERMLCCINADEYQYTAHFNAGAANGFDMVTEKEISFEGGLNMEPYSVAIIKM
jgi:glycosidase